MSVHTHPRRNVILAALSASLWSGGARAGIFGGRLAKITDFGATADSATVNTKAIQAAIDHLAGKGGGTVVVPPGVFVSGALFFKPGINLHFESGGVLRCSQDLENFPPQRTRIEGHFEDHFTPGLVNASDCDGFRMTGPGTLDGAGRPIWDRFYKMRDAAPNKANFPNIAIPRARLAIIETSQNVLIDGITFKDSQFWNLHLYRCRGVIVRNARFVVPDDTHAPSSDGIDIDSSQKVTVEGCYFSVTDDCIAAKGSKGPRAAEDKASPPVEHIRIRNCTFKRGNGVLTLGSEATLVRDIIVENCRVTGGVKVANLKLRPDTPQHYEDIHYRNISLDCDSDKTPIIQVAPWMQYFDLKGEAPPQSIVRNITLTGIRGRTGAFGSIAGNPGQTDISGMVLRDFNVQLKQEKLQATNVKNLVLQNVIVNGRPVPG